MSWLDKLKKGLFKTADLLRLNAGSVCDPETLEEVLIQADTGVQTAMALRGLVDKAHPKDMADLRQILSHEIIRRVQPIAVPLMIDKTHHPFVILMVGVNGAGKTTTVGKLGALFQKQGLQVSYAAADTFRAGAVEQLKKWGEKTGCSVYAGQPKADAAGVVFEAIRSAQNQKDDVLLIDTAGRLHTKTDLMDELKKIKRVIQKSDETAPHAVVLVLDATGGQNTLTQVRQFKEMIGVTGLVMTKLDGTAKGGILLALADMFQLPVHALGVGEQTDDLQPFTAEEYADSLLGEMHESC